MSIMTGSRGNRNHLVGICRAQQTAPPKIQIPRRRGRSHAVSLSGVCLRQFFTGRYASSIPGMITESSSTGRSMSVISGPPLEQKFHKCLSGVFQQLPADRDIASVIKAKACSVKINGMLQIDHNAPVTLIET